MCRSREIRRDSTSCTKLWNHLSPRRQRKPHSVNVDISRKRLKQEGTHGGTFKVLKDTTNTRLKPTWHTLGARAKRYKENTVIPAKWTSNKIPQRGVAAAGSPSRHCQPNHLFN
ncbi:BUB1-related (BUB1: budding uninhibited by benzymidazol 1) [Artemisia annua]|uniref:BUB1-related (BUB1: budding uninhibited by benzymidazol 1) n=1 Tax=Artemisia annua TaxID=35608 RepID=A0A2U1KHP2_ARTAN|nr:BUB1-related (BUB1: budding uninhibited by benzymidazol 1) [Artemisia annua]